MHGSTFRQIASVLILTILVWGCGGGGGGSDSGSEAQAPNLAAATAPSTHYVEVSFDGAPDADAARMDRYSISTTEGAPLAIRASELSDELRILLTTDGQQDVMYRLKARGYPVTLVRVLRDGDTWYRLQIGRFSSAEQANEMMRRLRDQEGVAHAFVASE